MEYNGWMNYETWLMNIWYGELFRDMATARTPEEWNGDLLKEAVVYWIEEETETGFLPPTGLVVDLLNNALSKVNWDELAEAFDPSKEKMK